MKPSGNWNGIIGRALAMLVLGCLMTGCNSQPRVGSPEAMGLIKQLYTACNTKNPQRLADSQTAFEQLVAENSLSDQERRAFQQIFDLAERGDWQAAEKRAFSFAKAQVR